MADARSAIFYFSTCNPKDHRGMHEMWHHGEFIGYIRIETTNVTCEDALSVAKPRRGESVMNTHNLKPATR